MPGQPPTPFRTITLGGRLNADGVVEPLLSPVPIQVEFSEDAEAYEPEERLEP